MARTPTRADLAVLWPALAYPAALTAGSFALAATAPGTRDAWVGYASTNLDNLADHPVRALLASAVLTDGDVVAWVVLAAVGLAGVARVGGPWRALAVAFAAHVVGTAVSEGGLALRVARGLAPAADRRIVDVGPSFAVVGVLVATVVAGAGAPWRFAAALGFGLLVPSLFGGLQDGDVAAVGHAVSVGVGLAAGALLLARRRRLAATP